MDEQTAAIMERLAATVERIESDLYSVDAESPGLALRLDRMERQIRQAFGVVQWIGGGGLLGLAATAVLLYRILQALPAEV